MWRISSRRRHSPARTPLYPPSAQSAPAPVRRLGAAIGVALAIALWAGALADGYTLGPYHYVHPPHFQALTNIYPSSIAHAVPISRNPTCCSVATPDAQVDIEFNGSLKTFGRPAGQTQVRFAIRPLRKFHVPSPAGGLVVDGNVYGLTAQFLPSGAPIGSTVRKLLITLDAPHNTPSNVMKGLYGGVWRPVCPKSTILYVGGLPACLTKRLPSQIAVFYSPSSHYGRPVKPKNHGGDSAISPFIVVAIVIVVLWAGLIIFLVSAAGPAREESAVAGRGGDAK